MVVTVYVWGFRKKEAVGHTSMLLGDGTYISWWPVDGAQGVAINTLFSKNKLATGAKAVRTLQEDIGLEGGTPNEYKLSGFDEKAIKQWWEKFKSENDSWHLAYLNCSTVVYRALCAGKPQLQAVEKEVLVWAPWIIESLVENLSKPAEQLKVSLRASMSTVNPLQSVGMSLDDLGRESRNSPTIYP